MKLDYKGTSIFYEDRGQGKAIIFLHGFLENSSMWNVIVSSLSENYRCVSIDLLGHGLTGSLHKIYSMELMADAVKHVLDHLKISRATFVGHSMGGYVALALAEFNPQLFEGLCLMNSSALEDSELRKTNRDRAVELVEKEKDRFISMSIANLFAQKNRERFIDEIENIKTEAMKMSVPDVIAAISGMKLRKNRVEILKNLNCKKLVVLGFKDGVLNVEEQIEYLKNLHIQVEVLDGGHMSQIENKDEITYFIKHFSEKL